MVTKQKSLGPRGIVSFFLFLKRVLGPLSSIGDSSIKGNRCKAGRRRARERKVMYQFCTFICFVLRHEEEGGGGGGDD